MNVEEVELREYWRIVRKRWILVVSIPVIAVIVAAVLSFFVIKPQYAANTTLLVNQKPGTTDVLSTDDVTVPLQLVNTYTAIIKSQSVANKVIQDLNLDLTSTQLDDMVKVSSPTQSQVIQVTVTSPSQNEATNIANDLATVFTSEAQSLMDVQDVQVVDPAINPATPEPVKPNKKLNVAIALILGLLVSIGLAFLMEYLDTRLRSEEEVQRYLNLPVLGLIIDYKDAK